LATVISDDSVLKLAEIMVRKKFRNRPDLVEWLIDEGYKKAMAEVKR
jgi:hypothetical protein